MKIRGTAQHIAEKYAALARDAQSSGDRVIAENYLQALPSITTASSRPAQAQMQDRFQRDERQDYQERDSSDRDQDDLDQGYAGNAGRSVGRSGSGQRASAGHRTVRVLSR